MSSMGDSDSKDDRVLYCSPTVNRGIFSCKKRCLSAVMMVLVSIVTINLTLVCWLITILNLNMHGMSYLHSFGGGIQFTGKTYVQNLLITYGLKTRENQPMVIRSVDKLTFRTVDKVGYLTSSIHLGEGSLDISSSNFTVTDPWGKALFSVDEDSVSVAAHSLTVSGEGGSALEGGLLTPVVSAGVRSDLVLESAMKGVLVVTPAGISIESRAGGIRVSSLQDTTFQTVDGSIKLESASVLMPGLGKMRHHRQPHHSDRIYQLCVCDNGQMFLGDSDASCDAGATILEVC